MKQRDEWSSSPAAGWHPPFAGLSRDHLLQMLLDSSQHPFHVIDPSTFRVVAPGDGAEQTGTTCYALTHDRTEPCCGPDHPCPVQSVVRSRQPVVVEHVHRDANGNQRNVEVHAFPLLDEQGTVNKVVEYFVDVTEREHIREQHLWESSVSKAIAALSDALIDPAFSIEEVADVVLEQTQRLTHSAHGFVSSVDQETGDMISHTLTKMMPTCRVAPGRRDIVFRPGPDGRYPGLWGHAANNAVGFYTETPSLHVGSTGLPEGHVPLDNFLTVPAMVGDKVVGQIALANSSRAYTDRDLEAVGRVATLYALAIRRRRSEEALLISEERYALAQRAANIGSWDWNITTGTLVWSDRIEPMFGVAKGQFDGTYDTFLSYVHAEDRQRVVDAATAAMERNEDYCIEHRIVQPNGQVRWMLETGDVFRDAAGTPLRMVGIVQDITARKEAEHQIRRLNEELERRVDERTAELTETNQRLRAESKRRQRLEKEILEISEREQRSIGRELHDSLGQQLTGIAIMAKVLEQKLQRRRIDEASDAQEIARLVNEAVSETRQLSRGLHPVALDEDELMAAMQSLAATTETYFGVSCSFHCDKPIQIRNASRATHLYRIAQEAVTNAIRHGRTRHIEIRLATDATFATLTITNDGLDFPAALPHNRGMGLQVMSYRAEMIDGVLAIERGPRGGTRVTCTFSIKTGNDEGDSANGRDVTGKDQII